MDNNNPDGALPGESQLNPSEPASNVGTPAPGATTPTPSQVEALSLTELNSLTGREFKSKESALKSIKDTYTFATTRITDVHNQVAAQVGEKYEKLSEDFAAQQREMFFLQNPQYAPHRKLIENLGKNPIDVVQSEIFKDTFNKLSDHDKTVKLKTVLESNPRLAASRDSLTKAADLKKSQNGFVTEEVERLATASVLDAFGLRG